MSDWSIEGWAIALAWAPAVLTVLGTVWTVHNRNTVALIWYDGAVRSPDGPTAQLTLANAGRGLALGVRVIGVGCHAQIDRPAPDAWKSSTMPDRQVLPAMATGEPVTVQIWCAPYMWARAELAVIWSPSPRLFVRRRTMRVALREAINPSLPVSFASSETDWVDLPPTEGGRWAAWRAVRKVARGEVGASA